MSQPIDEHRASDQAAPHPPGAPATSAAAPATSAAAPAAGAAASLQDARGVLAEAIAAMGGQVALTTEEQWDRASPCAGWTAADVVRHVVGTLTKTAEVLRGAAYGGEPRDPAGAGAGGDDAGSDPRVAWAVAAAEAERLLPLADPAAVVGTPRGALPTSAAIALPASDLAVHAWDLAAAGGREIELPAALLEHVRAIAESIPPQALRSPGLFGPELPAPEGASPTEALMAWLGRARPL